ncbi:hypothetical protein GCM10010282_37750 [Streptomyces roseolus]|nr:hypothetical protein GCM10010282_37750 [Streptomyces roseolus]
MPKTKADYVPQRLPAHLGFEQWRFDRALDLGLIPPADTDDGRRWTATTVDAVAARAADIRAATGTLPDMGATRAADLLAERFSTAVDADTIRELARAGHIPHADWYKHHRLYDGLALERFTDRDALQRAHRDGRLLDRHQAAPAPRHPSRRPRPPDPLRLPARHHPRPQPLPVPPLRPRHRPLPPRNPRHPPRRPRDRLGHRPRHPQGATLPARGSAEPERGRRGRQRYGVNARPPRSPGRERPVPAALAPATKAAGAHFRRGGWQGRRPTENTHSGRPERRISLPSVSARHGAAVLRRLPIMM